MPTRIPVHPKSDFFPLKYMTMMDDKANTTHPTYSNTLSTTSYTLSTHNGSKSSITRPTSSSQSTRHHIGALFHPLFLVFLFIIKQEIPSFNTIHTISSIDSIITWRGMPQSIQCLHGLPHGLLHGQHPHPQEEAALGSSLVVSRSRKNVLNYLAQWQGGILNYLAQ